MMRASGAFLVVNAFTPREIATPRSPDPFAFTDATSNASNRCSGGDWPRRGTDRLRAADNMAAVAKVRLTGTAQVRYYTGRGSGWQNLENDPTFTSLQHARYLRAPHRPSILAAAWRKVERIAPLARL